MKITRMRLGGIYLNTRANEDSPHRVGVYIGRQGKLIELLHADGRRTQYDSSHGLKFAFHLFDERSMRNWFANAEAW